MIYLAGKITNNPHAGDEFKEYERKLLLLDGVYNPFDYGKKLIEIGIPESDIMIDLLKVILKCDAIYFIPKWKESYGAMVEYYWAKKFGIKIINEE